MRIVCKNCKTLIIDTENKVCNSALYFDCIVSVDEEKMVLTTKSANMYIMCRMCGRKILISDIEKLADSDTVKAIYDLLHIEKIDST